MRPIIHALVTLILALSTSCYQGARIARLSDSRGLAAGKGPVVHSFRIGGLNQMLIYLDPDRGILDNRKEAKSFTQEELSQLRVKVTSSDGRLDVNGKIVDPGDTLVVDLTKRFDSNGGEGAVTNRGGYIPTIRFVSDKEDSTGGDRLCNFVLIVEDPLGITRETGIRVTGGFQDSL